MEIDITEFVRENDPSEFSASAMELGSNAGRITWEAAMREAAHKPLLKTEDELDALREWARNSGGWDKTEREGWDAQHCNALFIQLVSGDMREMGLDECDIDEFDWDAYEKRSDGGGNLYVGDDDKWYYNLSS